ncbi:MAG TPA: hypothetical protein VN737_18070 [Bryobacteraceae bacterium]|jgi:hypothetical protein|nr:hypothetical protein [Bryobacteraceae bacterium]
MARPTRREIAALLVVAPIAAQTSAPPSQPSIGAPASTLQTAYRDVADTSRKLGAISVPMDAPPAFVFKA